jgi:hypothetical protein
MKIQGLVYDVVLEQFKSKTQFDRLVKKWYGDNPTPEQVQKSEKMITLFMQKQKSLNPENPIVNSFLSRFDGTFSNEFPVFDPKNLKDPSQYTLSQMESLYDDLTDETTEEIGAFSGGKYSGMDKIKASYSLWDGDEYKIIDEGGVRVYFIPDQNVSMKFGYYQQAVSEWDGKWLGERYPEIFNDETKKELQKELPYVGILNGQQWCVTGRGTNDSRSNLWGTYRDNRTFYFIIDESKSPSPEINRDISRYYIAAIQVDISIREGYRVTSGINDGDNPKTWDEIIRIYPQLSEHKDKFVRVSFDVENEMENKDEVSRVTEALGNRYEFRRQNKRLKKAYLDRGGNVTKAHSWKSMTDDLRQVYILSTISTNVLDRFQTVELMNEIRKKGSEFNLLNKRLNQIGVGGVSFIYDHLMKNEFDIARSSVDNNDLRMYRSKTTEKYGLYDAKNAKWIVADGVTFEPSYSEIDRTMYIDYEGNIYVVETYSEANEPTPTSFYCVFLPTEENKLLSGHFITSPKFELLKEKITPADEDGDVGFINDFNPETDVDIREMKKGL